MPKLTDDGEMDIIRDTYFEGKPTQKTFEEQEELQERANVKRKNNNQNR